MSIKNILMFIAFCFSISCSDGGSGECSSSSLLKATGLVKTVALGGKCIRKSNSDCSGIWVNNCLEGECFHDLCQPGQCQSDGDCRNFGASAKCKASTLDGKYEGAWCGIDYTSPGGGSCDDGCLDNCYVGADCLALCCR